MANTALRIACSYMNTCNDQVICIHVCQTQPIIVQFIQKNSLTLILWKDWCINGSGVLIVRLYCKITGSFLPFQFLLRGEVWTQNQFNPATIYLDACTKSRNWAVIYLGIRGIDLFMIFLLEFRKCSDDVVFPLHVMSNVATISCKDQVIIFVAIEMITIPVSYYKLTLD